MLSRAVVLLGVFVNGTAGAAPPALTPPSADVLSEAQAIVARMERLERGPYSRIRWYCTDGTVLPPTPYACREHGGGRQYAEYSTERERLAALGWPVGTILAATPWDELWDADRRNLRLRQLLVERYLVTVDDGWVLRRARAYRGRIQVEDEEAAGRELLLGVLAQTDWLDGNYLLAREAVRDLPHNRGTDRTSGIRSTSQAIAERDPTFEPIRIAIHTAPGPADLDRVRAWIADAERRRVEPDLLDSARTLLAELEKVYGGAEDPFEEIRRLLARHPQRAALTPLLADLEGLPPLARCDRLGVALARTRELVVGPGKPAARLTMVDASLAIERELQRAAFATLAQADPVSRSELLSLSRDLVAGAYGAGLLSARERAALEQPLEPLAKASTAPTVAYATACQRLRRAAAWALGTVRFTFAEPLVSFGTLEPKALRWTDEVLRRSAMLPLAETTSRLVADSDELSGRVHRVFGEVRGGLVGLNPGIARGRLRIVDDAQLAADAPLGRDEIVVLPRTVSDLQPVAGILSLAEGNLLSHVQLLARNLGIPNATISPALAGALREHAGREVVLAVSSDGSVLLDELESLPAPARSLLETGRPATPTQVDAPHPDLSVRRPIPLAELEAGMAGRVVGPKAANLGELAHHFPGRVEQAIALPFGVFAEHVADGPDSPKNRLDRAFAAARSGSLDAAGLAAEVEAVRKDVTKIRLHPDLLAELEPLMARLFGPPGSYGLFIRSDTNVEDLPGFTGAGLNETLPNVVDPAAQRTGIARVWASPFTERAVAWRGPLLRRPEEVYTSVLLMKSVTSEKSGVLVTTDLVGRGSGVTVAMSWGVGGAVDGDDAETLVIVDDGSVRLIGEAKAPYQRRLRPAGGVEWVPAAAGRVLSEDEIAAVAQLAGEVRERLAPAAGPDGQPLPWDVELGFVAGQPRLFQIRPLVERGQILADRLVGMAVTTTQTAAPSVRLDAPVRSTASPAVGEPQ